MFFYINSIFESQNAVEYVEFLKHFTQFSILSEIISFCSPRALHNRERFQCSFTIQYLSNMIILMQNRPLAKLLLLNIDHAPRIVDSTGCAVDKFRFYVVKY